MEGDWIKAFSGLDAGVMTAIGVIAFVLHRWTAMATESMIVVAMAMGAVYGFADGLGTFDPAKGNYALGSYILKGAMMNGAGAAASAIALSKFLDSYVGPSSRAAPKAVTAAVTAVVADAAAGVVAKETKPPGGDGEK